MPTFEYRSGVEVTPDVVYEWHAQPGAFERLIPPWEPVQVIEHAPGLAVGNRTVVETRIGPTKQRFAAKIVESEPGVMFRDVQEEGPFASWEHTHRFVPEAKKFCLIEDRVDYELPMGFLGKAFGSGYAERRLARLFDFRHDRTRYDISRLRVLRRKLGDQRIAVTGASGLIGRELVNYLRSGGMRVDPLVRRQPRPGTTEIYWNPETGEIDAEALEGVDAVVHLAGENLAADQWTAEFKEKVRLSRFQGTNVLCHALANLKHKPRVLVSASAIGWYGSRGDEELYEDAAPGTGFLAEVCKSWEKETRIAAEAGIQTVNARIGIVISARGGLLAKVLPMFRRGLGARVGSGKQWMAWVSLEDVIGGISHMLHTGELSGPVNLTAPHPVTNADFTRILANVLHRPAMFSAPESAIRRFMGERGESLALQSARVKPRRILDSGFRFIHQELSGAFCHELGIRTVVG